jgi:WD40 repeat protein
LLDALDEDSAAIENFADRLSEIVELAGKFRAIIVTCRTQFLTDVTCIPTEIDLAETSGPMALSGCPNRTVRRLYLSPFSELQVKKYLNARFSYWHHPLLRVRAGRAAQRFRDLMSRPLLLTFIQDLASSSEEPKYSFQAYRLIVEGWLGREKRKHGSTIQLEDLLRFSEDFAVCLFATGRDRVLTAELQSIAKRFHVGPVLREVRERSLLHNDAEGNWKFVHRSIMEYFLVNAASAAVDSRLWAERPWTDQMRQFASEMLQSGEWNNLPGADLHGLDIRGADLSGRDLSGANLRGTNLSYSHLNTTILIDANLSEAHLGRASLDLANVRGARLDGTALGGVDLGKVRGLTLLQAATAIADQVAIWPSRILVGHSKSVAALAVTLDGRCAVSASIDKTLKVWDLETGAELRTLRGHSSQVRGVAVTPDGMHAVSASIDKTIKVWDLRTGVELRTLAGHYGPVYDVTLTPDGRRAVSVSGDGTLKVWDLETGCELRTIDRRSTDLLILTDFVAVTPDGKCAISSSSDRTLKVWELDTGIELRTLAGHSDSVYGVAVTSDGRNAVTASRDKTLKVWDLDTGDELLTFVGHSGPVYGVALTPDGRHAVSASGDKTLKLWNMGTGGELLTLAGHSDSSNAVALDGDGRLAVSASEDKTLRVWFPPEVSGTLEPRYAARNAELMALQRLSRRRVHTPEFYFSKYFDNSRLVRPLDPVRRRELRWFSIAITILFTLIMIYGLQHFYTIELSYRVESEKLQLDQLHEENLELRLAEEQLKARARLGLEKLPTQPSASSISPPKRTLQSFPPPTKP